MSHFFDMTSSRQSSKLSPQFRAHLQTLGDEVMLAAVVLLDLGASPRNTRRQSAAARASAIQHNQQRGQQALAEIDAVLAAHGGERLTDAPNLLGALPIRARRATLFALAELPSVKAIIEDQQIGTVGNQ